jgi:hypothetical protein
MVRRTVSLVTLFVLVGATAALSAAPAGAATVTTEAELRAAFAADTAVDLGADITLTDCTAGEDGALVREASNTDPVTLDGHGFTLRQTCAVNVVIDNAAAALTVRNLTVTGGNTDGSGGGIFTVGDLTIEDSVLTGNHADGAGGGAVTNAALVVRRTSVVGNSTGKGGGGLQGNLDVTVIDSNVSENINGGIATNPSESAHLTVVNTTVHHNTLAGLGGGVFSGGDATFVYATITDNTANQAYADVFVNGTLSSFGTVVSGPPGDDICLAGPSSVSQGYNFNSDDSCRFTAPTDRENAGDPLLGPLASNGGPTQSRLPLAGSPLLDAIPQAACPADVTTDQRGVARPQAGSCDIGSVEVEVITPVPVPVPLPVTPRFTG